MTAPRPPAGSPPLSVRSRVSDLRLLTAEDEVPARFLGRWTNTGDEVVVSRHPDSTGSRTQAWRRWREADTSLVCELMHHARMHGCDYEVVRHHPGGTLRDLLRAGVAVPSTPVTRWVEQLVRAIAHLHTDLRLLHGAVTPDAIAVTDGRPRRVLLGGLGTARTIRAAAQLRPASSMHRWLERMGSDLDESALDTCDFRYLAPERVYGEWRTAGDYWSLGVVLLELLVGHYPFPVAADAEDKGRAEFRQFICTRHINAADYLGPAGVDLRLATLIDGLLTQAAQVRWGADEVLAWLDGDAPEVLRPVNQPAALTRSMPPEPALAPSSGPYAFLSYSRTNRPYAQRLKRHLEERHIAAWMDDQVRTGEPWRQVIDERVRRSAAVIVVMTPEAAGSRWVEREINEAEAHGRPVLPLLLDGARFSRLSDLQFENVVGGLMPSADFVERIRDHLRGGR